MSPACLCFPTLEFSKSSPLSFTFLGGLLSLVGGLYFLSYWFCMALTGLTTRESSLLSAPNAPIKLMIGGALRVYSTNAGASADLLSCSIHGRLGCAVLSLSS